ncbi:MAG: hypothetical protein Q9171_007613, partial [Xanthocarpia ochracea]
LFDIRLFEELSPSYREARAVNFNRMNMEDVHGPAQVLTRKCGLGKTLPTNQKGWPSDRYFGQLMATG